MAQFSLKNSITNCAITPPPHPVCWNHNVVTCLLVTTTITGATEKIVFKAQMLRALCKSAY